MKKTFEVRVYEMPYTYEVKAKTKEEAEAMVMNREWMGNYDNIKEVKVEIVED